MFVYLNYQGKTPGTLWSAICKSLKEAGLEFRVEYLCAQCILQIGYQMQEIPRQATSSVWKESDLADKESFLFCKSGHRMTPQQLKEGYNTEKENRNSEGLSSQKIQETLENIKRLKATFISDVTIHQWEDFIGAFKDYWFTLGMYFPEIHHEMDDIKDAQESPRQKLSMIIWKLHTSTEKIPIERLVSFLTRCLKELNASD